MSIKAKVKKNQCIRTTNVQYFPTVVDQKILEQETYKFIFSTHSFESFLIKNVK